MITLSLPQIFFCILVARMQQNQLVFNCMIMLLSGLFLNVNTKNLIMIHYAKI